MLSLQFIRENPDEVREAVARRHVTAPIDDILRLDGERRRILLEMEALTYIRGRSIPRQYVVVLDSSSNGLTCTAERPKAEVLHGHITLLRSERSSLAAVAAALL